jgi:ribosomal protein S18 acetylase RimI-like enzyme
VTDFTIRSATVEDAPALARLRWRFKQEDSAETLPDEPDFLIGCEHWLRTRLQDRWLAWVAQADAGDICGHVFLGRVEKVPDPEQGFEELGYVTNFYVIPEWRNRGLGRALLDAMQRYGREDRLDTLIVWPSERSAPLYHRAGFLPSDELLELPIRP